MLQVTRVNADPGAGVVSVFADMTSPVLESPFRLPPAPSEPELVAKYLRVLSDPIRLRIVELVADEERSVGALVDALGVAQPKVSNHLACLRWCGFVETRREHRTIYYRLADSRVSEIIELARGLLAENADHVSACRRVDEGWGCAQRSLPRSAPSQTAR